MVAGDEAGRLLMFTGRALTAVHFTSHNAPITAMATIESDRLVTVCRNFAILFSQELQPLHVHEMSKLSPPPALGASPLTLCTDGTGNRLLLGYDSSHLYELAVDFR